MILIESKASTIYLPFEISFNLILLFRTPILKIKPSSAFKLKCFKLFFFYNPTS